jgi:hypothetical protein
MSHMQRRWRGLVICGAVVMSCLGLGIQIAGGQQTTQTAIAVYKSATCGCCQGWVEHLRGSGFAVTAHDVDDLAGVKTTNNVPSRLQSCHTAVVGGYVIEGHVPADVIQRLLKERPAIAGLAVPGMPVGSPGMEVPGAPRDPYNVVSFDKQGTVAVYESRR